VQVSTKDTSAKGLSISLLQLFSINATYITETLIDLAKITRDKLKDVERELEVLWVAAQQVNARQKVEVSIR
jgi:replicative DNA helicase